jgi:D-xylose transport system substrate-binding protein
LVLVPLLGLSMALTACGSDDSDSGSDSGSSDSSSSDSSGKIGVILPDTESSVRWESADRPALEAAFDEAGVDYDIQNAEGDAEKMTQIADTMIGNGVTVLAIVNLDSESGAAIQEKAKSQGVATIDYDRLTLGGSAEYYVSFDNTKVGELQGQGLADCLGDKDANIVYLNGAPTDNNATLFAKGAHNVLDKVSNYKKVAEQPVPDWEAEKAATIFEQMWTEQHGKIDGVVAANDNLGNAVISILKKNKRAGDIPVTGQDATVQGLQNILDGNQCMTVYKPTKQEADAAAKLAISLIKGEKGETTATENDPVGKRDVPSVLLEPVSVTKENVKRVVDDGAVKAADLCKGAYAAKCEAAGITVQ